MIDRAKSKVTTCAAERPTAISAMHRARIGQAHDDARQRLDAGFTLPQKRRAGRRLEAGTACVERV